MVDEERTCSHRGCEDVATKRWSPTTFYCGKHAAIRAMRCNARFSRKFVPTIREIEAVWPEGDICPRCKRVFVYGNRVQTNASPSLQHFAPTAEADNPIGVVCHRCNNNLRNLGDGVEALNIPLNLRRCTRCKCLKDKSEFGWHTSKVTGKSNIGSHCKPCTVIAAAENKLIRKGKE